MNSGRKSILGWAFVAIMAFLIVAPLPEAESIAEPTPLHYVRLIEASGNDTLFYADSYLVTVHFEDGQDLEWAHAVAPSFAGGDSAGINVGITVYFSNDGLTFYASGEILFAGAEAETLRSAVVTVPMLLRAIRFKIESDADNDTTIIGGYYIYH